VRTFTVLEANSVLAQNLMAESYFITPFDNTVDRYYTHYMLNWHL